MARTGGTLPDGFYVGNGLGSFNLWMRLITGWLFGIGVMWTVLPHLFAPPAKSSRQREAS